MLLFWLGIRSLNHSFDSWLDYRVYYLLVVPADLTLNFFFYYWLPFPVAIPRVWEARRLGNNFDAWGSSTLGEFQRLGKFDAWGISTLGEFQRLGKLDGWASSTLGEARRLEKLDAWGSSTLGEVRRLGKLDAWGILTLGEVRRLGNFDAWGSSTLGEARRLGNFDAWGSSTLGEVRCFAVVALIKCVYVRLHDALRSIEFVKTLIEFTVIYYFASLSIRRCCCLRVYVDMKL